MNSLKGNDIVCSFDLVNQVWKEVDLMSDRLSSLLTRKFIKPGMKIDKARSCRLFSKESYGNVPIGNIVSIHIKSAPRRRKADTFLNFQISLGGHLIDIPDNRE